jgi:hypothetical protein
MIPMDKIYLVTSEWSTYNGDHEFMVVGAFFDLRKATECMEQERNTIITESYHYDSLQEARDSDSVVIEEETDRFFIMDESLIDKWDELRIDTMLVEQRDVVSIQFEYAGEMFIDRVYVDQIDMTHYDNLWDWWFNSHNSKFPELVFELTADKDANGNPSAKNAYINVYENTNADDPIAVIQDVKLQIILTERTMNYGLR